MAAFKDCHSFGRALPGLHVMMNGQCRPASCKGCGGDRVQHSTTGEHKLLRCFDRAHLVRGHLASGAVSLWGAQEGTLSRLQPVLLSRNSCFELLHNSKIQLFCMPINNAVPIRILHMQPPVEIGVHLSCQYCNNREWQKQVLPWERGEQKHTGTLQTY